MQNNNKLRLVIYILAFAMLSACSTPELGVVEAELIEEPAPAPLSVDVLSPPFIGIWFTLDRSSMLIITEEAVYYHEFGSKREVYARIDGFDLESHTINVFITAILSGGTSMGYDSPNRQISYQVNGNQLVMITNPLDLLSDDEGSVIYSLDEFLN